jgi:hypothetical protein
MGGPSRSDDKVFLKIFAFLKAFGFRCLRHGRAPGHANLPLTTRSETIRAAFRRLNNGLAYGSPAASRIQGCKDCGPANVSGGGELARVSSCGVAEAPTSVC